jgi:hypothetical protein
MARTRKNGKSGLDDWTQAKQEGRVSPGACATARAHIMAKRKEQHAAYQQSVYAIAKEHGVRFCGCASVQGFAKCKHIAPKGTDDQVKRETVNALGFTTAKSVTQWVKTNS